MQPWHTGSQSQVSEKPKVPGHGDGRGKFVLNLEEALTPDPGTEDMYRVDGVNKFAFTPGQLSKLLNPKSLSAFYALGGIAGLEKGLRTDSRAGLSVDETTLDGCVTYEEAVGEDVAARVHSRGDKEAAKAEAEGRAPTGIANPHEHRKEGPFADRLRVFRENRLPDKKTRSIWELAWSTYNDKVLILLTIAAVVSLALGLYQTFGQQHDSGEARVEWVEGVAIMVAIVVVVVVGTINDWQMERQFQALNAKNEARNVKVIRSGKSQEISVYDIMVGDLVHLYPGDLVPVDGIFVQGHGVKCDESSATGESDLLRKTPAAEVFEALKKLDRDDIEKLDPFIISGSKVQEGTGTFLVTAVGVNSSYGRTTMALREEPEPTPLQRKLNVLADYIAKIGGSAALLLFVVLFIKFLVELRGSTDTPSQKGQNFLRIFIQAVTVVVVAVPEGLPLAVTLALAFATTRMLKDNNLVRVLRACETMGNATTICSDKTGTLTQNRMTVVACTIGRDRSFGGDGPELAGPNESEAGKAPAEPKVKAMQVGEFVKSLSSEVKDLVVQANAVNSTAFEGVVEDKHTFIGSKTEVALLEFCKNHLGAGPVAEERANADVVQVVPFDSAVKYMATVVRLANGKFRVYAKGASEILLDRCTRILADPSADDLGTVELAQADKDALLQIITSYASQTLRTISVSFRDFDVWPPPDAVSEEDPKLADFTKAHRDMTLLGIFGIKDPLRPGVIDAVKDCQKAGVVVRMVTGDNILTARAIATECGIYSPETHGLAMEGPVFRRLSDEELTQKVGKLQVLARSSPEDKRILVKKLKDLGETVAVTGDGTNDAPALKSADIGFSMGIAGTEVAKEASDIVLMDDNFSSIVKGIMWGRAVNDSVRKFLQVCLAPHGKPPRGGK